MSYAQQSTQSRPAGRLYTPRMPTADISLENSKQDQNNLPILAQKVVSANLHYNTGSSLASVPSKNGYYPIIVQTDECGRYLQFLPRDKALEIDQEAINSIAFINSGSMKVAAIYGSMGFEEGITCVIANDALQTEKSTGLEYFTKLPNDLKSLAPYRFDDSLSGQQHAEMGVSEEKKDIKLFINKLATAMSYYISGDDAKGVDKIPIIIAYEGEVDRFERLSMQKVDQLPIDKIETMEFKYTFSPKKRKFQAKDCLMVVVLKAKK